MPPHALWLACFPDGAQRPVVGRQRQRFTYRLPASHSLRRLLVEFGGPGFDEKVLCSLGGTAVRGAFEVWGAAPSHKSAVALVALCLVDSEGAQ